MHAVSRPSPTTHVVLKAALVTFCPEGRSASAVGTQCPSLEPNVNGCVAASPSRCTESQVPGIWGRPGNSPVHQVEPPTAQLMPSGVVKNRYPFAHRSPYENGRL